MLRRTERAPTSNIRHWHADIFEVGRASITDTVEWLQCNVMCNLSMSMPCHVKDGITDGHREHDTSLIWIASKQLTSAVSKIEFSDPQVE